jgi:fermentation-respiration switch protein FrsA (DUF1100 family)
VSSYATHPVSFDSHGSTIAGMLYLPADQGEPWPCVVLAHGFSGTMDWIVPDFAAAFANGGLAALTFDYRYMGVSEGEPRQLVDTRRQLEDLRCAVEFVRTLPRVDAARIALWGTSLGGSHVINLAAEDHAIAAVVANVPGLDLFVRGVRGRYVPPHIRLSRWDVARSVLNLVALASLDAARGAAGLSPHYIPVYGRLGHAVFSDPALAGLFRDVEQNAPSWRNRVTPRFLFTAPRYRDGTMERITAPLMATIARDDEVVSSAFVKETVAKAGRHVIREFPVQHFQMYHGAVRDAVVTEQVAFLREHLLPVGDNSADRR